MRTLISRWGGWGALAAGAVLCAIGWYGVSGERFAERQIPYLASCTVPGAALIVAGAVLLAAQGAFGSGRAASAVAPLPPTMAETAPPADGTEGDAGHDESGEGEGGDGGEGNEAQGDRHGSGVLVAVPAGTLAHDPGCPLVDGKPEAVPLDEDALRARALRPCPICEPGLPPEGPEPEDREVE